VTISPSPTKQFSEVSIRTAIGKDLATVVGDLMDKMRWQELIPPGGFVALKPNFCEYRPDRIENANTSFSVIEAVCQVLSSRAGRIAIVESDGLRYRVEEVYRTMGMERLTRRYGVRLVNLTRERVMTFPEPLLEGFGLPAILGECDCFISLPKLKTHALTYFTGALKNQWGCIPRPDRILLHKHIHTLIPRINQLLNPRLAIMDGLVAMEGRGPTNGVRRDLSLLLASRDLVALDAAAMRLVGLEPKSARHVVEAAAMGMGKLRGEEIRVDRDDSTPIAPFIPARKEWTLELMNYLTRYRPFVYHFLLDDRLFNQAKSIAVLLRRWRLS
jgi:uncharacterized protein (DUF362 family)